MGCLASKIIEAQPEQNAETQAEAAARFGHNTEEKTVSEKPSRVYTRDEIALRSTTPPS
jgi:hypothetical protein